VKICYKLNLGNEAVRKQAREGHDREQPLGDVEAGGAMKPHTIQVSRNSLTGDLRNEGSLKWVQDWLVGGAHGAGCGKEPLILKQSGSDVKVKGVKQVLDEGLHAIDELDLLLLQALIAPCRDVVLQDVYSSRQHTHWTVGGGDQ